jgi:hypothetical protein
MPGGGMRHVSPSASDDGGDGLVMAVNLLDQDFHGRPTASPVTRSIL